MITDSKKWYYVSVKSISTLFRGITSKHVEDFCCLNCFHSYRTENILKNLKNYVMMMIIVTNKCLVKTIKYQNITTQKS